MNLPCALLILAVLSPLCASDALDPQFGLELSYSTQGILAAPFPLEIQLIRRDAAPWICDGRPIAEDGTFLLPGRWDLVLEELDSQGVTTRHSLKPIPAAAPEPFAVPVDRYACNAWSLDAKNLFTHAGTYRFILSYGACERRGPDTRIRDTVIPPGIAVTVTPDRLRAVLGEAVFVDIAVENHGTIPFHAQFGGDYRGTTRALRFFFTATRADGVPCNDPEPLQNCWGGMSGSGELAPGERNHQEVLLNAYVRFHGPGTYMVTAYHALEFGAPVPGIGGIGGYGPYALAGTFTLVIDPPDPDTVARLVTTILMPDAPPAPQWSLATHLHQACFLDALVEAFAHAGEVDRACLAMDAIHSIATIGATRALIACAHDERPAVRSHALAALAERIPPRERPHDVVTPGRPDPLAQVKTVLTRSMWDERFAVPLRRLIDQEAARSDPATLGPMIDLTAALDFPGAEEVLASVGDVVEPPATGDGRSTRVPDRFEHLLNPLGRAAYALGAHCAPLCHADAGSSPGRLTVWAHLFVGSRCASTPASDALFLAMITNPSSVARMMAMTTMPTELPERVTMPWRDLFMDDDGHEIWRLALSHAEHDRPDVVAAAIQACPQSGWSEVKRKAFARFMEELQGR